MQYLIFSKTFSMKSLFQNIEHQQQIDEYGYLKLPFLGEKEVEALLAIFESEIIINETDCYASNTVSDDLKNIRINELIFKQLNPFFENLFVDFTSYGGTFLVKIKQNTELGFHQDTTIVNPDNFRMYYIWIPLQDVTPKNGCLFLIEKSHRFFEQYFSYAYFSADIKRNKIPYSIGKDIIMKKGDIFIFNSRLFHGSYRNNNDAPRVAVQSIITTKGAPLTYYSKKDDNTAEEYEVSSSSYLNSYKDYKNGGLPQGAKLISSFPYKHIPIDFKLLYTASTSKNYTNFTRITTFLSTRFHDFIHNLRK